MQSPTSVPQRCIVLVGATSAIAAQCAREWLKEEAADLILVGRDESRLVRIGQDLLARSPASQVTTHVLDLTVPESIQGCVTTICRQHSPDLVLIAHGLLPDQLACQADLELAWKTMQINALSPALFVEAFAAQMHQRKPASLIVIGSVAGDRGRQSNYVYGAAKGMLERYVQGLQHRLALEASPLHVLLVKPGPTSTPMTANLALAGTKMATVSEVATDIVKGVKAKKLMIYTPRKWGLIMAVIRSIPGFIFHKIKI